MTRIKSQRGWIMTAVLILMAVQNAKSQEAMKTSGVMFGDMYYIQQSNIDSLKGQYGFLIRRINLTFDKKTEDRVSVRVRLEMKSPNVDKRPETKLTPYIKDAYLSYNIGSAKFTFGVQPTIILESPEKVWGLRAVEKTLLDFQRIVPSRDLGISLNFKKSIGELSILSAKGGKNKLNNYFGLKIEPFKGLIFDFSGRYEIIDDSTTATLLRPFIGYNIPTFRVGAEFGYYQKKNGRQGFASIFAAKEITRRMEAYLRYDRVMQANPEGDKISYMPLSKFSKANLIYAGLSYKIIKNVSLIPNVAYVMYDNKNITNDFYVKLTFYASF